ncbi:MAG: PAS domain S-box protein, partial [Dehalococcoidia bacterium]
MQDEVKLQKDIVVQLDEMRILDHIDELIVYQETDMRLVWANKAACASVGLSLDELVGRCCYSVWAQRNEPCVDCPLIKARETGKPQSADIPVPGGRYYYIKGYPVIDKSGGITGMIEIASDITERKLAEFAQKKSEERYRTVLKTSIDGFTIDTLDGKLLEVNDSYCNMTGYTREEILSMRISDLEVMEKPEEILQHGNKIMEQGYDRFETRHRRKDGRIIDLEVSANYVDIEEGLVFISIRDITERKQAENVLRESEEKLRLMFESVNDGIAVSDLDGNLVQVNTADVLLHGFTSTEEMIGQPAFDLVAERDRHKVKRTLEKCVEEGRIRSIEYNLLRKDGTEFPAELSAAVLKDVSGKPFGIIGVIKDITGRKELEEKLRRDERI